MSKYQVVIYLHHIDDREYAEYVSSLFRSLFKVPVTMRHRESESVLALTISRIQLVSYLHSLGLPIGNKTQQYIDIPLWIQEDESLAISCLRGLIDTDGCVVIHKYISKSKLYTYKKITFTSASKVLRESVHQLLTKLEMNPRFGRNQDIWLDSKTDINRYFKLVGSNNPKHLRRYCF